MSACFAVTSVFGQEGELRRIRIDTVGNEKKAGSSDDKSSVFGRGNGLDQNLKSKNAILWHPMALSGSHLMLGYERLLSKSLSGRLQASYGLSDQSEYYDVSKLQAWYVELQMRYYFAGGRQAPVGFYGGTYILTKQVNYQYEVFRSNFVELKERTRSATGGGIIMGIQTSLARNVVIDFYLGAGPVFSESLSETEEADDTFRDSAFIDTWRTRMASQFGLAIGFAF